MVPRERKGKHKEIVKMIFSALDGLAKGQAIRITKAELADDKGVRAALYRAARLSGHKVATTTDANLLYVWKKS
jgi:hypothetical protein